MGWRGADAVIEVSGAGALDRSIASVLVGGTLCRIGVPSGAA